jgi:predicted N-acetyltransferase YhbS
MLGLTFVSVHLDYQKQGVGSMMMEHICKEADELRGHLYVLASPAGVKLYSKFNFETVGKINTAKGVITSMLRKADESRRIL